MKKNQKFYSILKSKNNINTLFASGSNLRAKGIVLKYYLKNGIRQEDLNNRRETGQIDSYANGYTFHTEIFITSVRQAKTKVERNRIKRIIRAHLEILGQEKFFEHIFANYLSKESQILYLAFIGETSILQMDFTERKSIFKKITEKLEKNIQKWQ